MEAGYLSSYFEGVVAKRLSAVEAHQDISNQHEFNGVVEMKAMFGEERTNYDAQFLYLCEDEGEYSSSQGFVTWYDARKNHATRTEYRLYFQSTDVSARFKAGDLLVIGKRHDNSVVVISAEKGSTAENQLIWLFGLSTISEKFTVKALDNSNDIKLAFASRFILDELGIQPETADVSSLEIILKKFGNKFPSTNEFSAFARETLPDISPLDDPDVVLLSWLEQEEKLFVTLERHIVSARLKTGFGDEGQDVDGFLGFSLSVQNRRKSRAGHSLENHLEQIFSARSLKYSRGKATEKKSKPDFIFPSIEDYKNQDFNSAYLTMLGAKSSCKDRWRQVLSEAERIPNKHLLTLEPAISMPQTDEMKSHSLQLVIPKGIHRTYNESQQSWLMNLSDFIAHLKAQALAVTIAFPIFISCNI